MENKRYGKAEKGSRPGGKGAEHREQQESQQQILTEVIEQQQTEMARYRDEMKELLTRMKTDAGKKMTKVSLPKPTLQKFGSENNIEHLNTVAGGCLGNATRGVTDEEGNGGLCESQCRQRK